MIYNFKNNFIFIMQKIYYEKYNFNEDLKYFHKILETEYINNEQKCNIQQIKLFGNDRNSVFYDDYHFFVDNNNLFNKIYYQFIEDYVKPLYANKDNKIIVQKTPNLRISLPNLTAIGKNEIEDVSNNIIGMHKDADFGHHEDEINFIIPITEMFETNSIYYEEKPDSNISSNEYTNLKLNVHEFFVEKLNHLNHFNKINQTGVSRLSLDFRIIPYEKYMKNIEYFKDTKFALGKYYIILF
jgi:hypothetical protein